jgi:dolichyl-diphosphooligosaccharide--protein glycosyltransferase
MKNDMKIFVLIIGITGVYISSAFVRLEVFASISLIILGSIGLSILTKEIFKIEFSGKKKYILKIPYAIIIIIIFLLPLTYPADANWLTYTDIPVTILNGGTGYPASTDWLETLEWIKINTPEDSVVASWWDYGYWITTMSERTTLIDNATLADNQIERFAKILLSTPDEAWIMLEEWEVDYVVVFVAANHFMDDAESGLPLYVLNGGGDESKKQWFMKIAGLDYRKYILADGLTGSNLFWNETLLGKMIPFGPVIYYNEQTGENSLVYKEGMLEITTKDIKFNSESHPLKLVYASSGFTEQKLGPMNSVFVYEVNKNFIPNSINE